MAELKSLYLNCVRSEFTKRKVESKFNGVYVLCFTEINMGWVHSIAMKTIQFEYWIRAVKNQLIGVINIRTFSILFLQYQQH